MTCIPYIYFNNCCVCHCSLFPSNNCSCCTLSFAYTHCNNFTQTHFIISTHLCTHSTTHPPMHNNVHQLQTINNHGGGGGPRTPCKPKSIAQGRPHKPSGYKIALSPPVYPLYHRIRPSRRQY